MLTTQQEGQVHNGNSDHRRQVPRFSLREIESRGGRQGVELGYFIGISSFSSSNSFSQCDLSLAFFLMVNLKI